MVEVLVALLIVALGVLGAVGLQLSSLQHMRSSTHRAMAVMATIDIVDRMRANRTQAINGQYNISLTSVPAPAGTGAATEAIDLYEWRTRLADWLPEGVGAVTRMGDAFRITVQWSEEQSRDGDEEQQFIFETQL